MMIRFESDIISEGALFNDKGAHIRKSHVAPGERALCDVSRTSILKILKGLKDNLQLE